MATPGISQGQSQYDVVGASEGPDIGNLNPDSQSFLLRALAQHLDSISRVVMSNKDAPIEQVEYELDASVIAGGQSYKLPTGAAIVSYYVENNSGSIINVSTGASGAGRSINAIAPYSYKVALCPQQTTSIALLAASPAMTGLVRILLTSVPLGPAIGSTIGNATSPDYNITTITTAAATPCPGLNGAAARYIVGVINNSLAAQNATLGIYDNPAAASGTVYNIGPLGIGQIITYPSPGIRLANGATALASAAPGGGGVQILTR